MYGEYTDSRTGAVSAAFCEDDFLYTVTTERDGVETRRAVVTESELEALLALVANEEAWHKANKA